MDVLEPRCHLWGICTFMTPLSAFWSLGLYGPSVILCGLCAFWPQSHLFGLWAFVAAVSSEWSLGLYGPSVISLAFAPLWPCLISLGFAPLFGPSFICLAFVLLWPQCDLRPRAGRKIGQKADNFTVRVQLVKSPLMTMLSPSNDYSIPFFFLGRCSCFRLGGCPLLTLFRCRFQLRCWIGEPCSREPFPEAALREGCFWLPSFCVLGLACI